MADGEVEALAAAIAVGALRYFMLRFGRHEGRRLRFRGGAQASRARPGPTSRTRWSAAAASSASSPSAGRGRRGAGSRARSRARPGRPERARAARTSRGSWCSPSRGSTRSLAAAVPTLELSLVARWAFETAQRFHKYYERYRILGEPDAGPPARARGARLALPGADGTGARGDGHPGPGADVAPACASAGSGPSSSAAPAATRSRSSSSRRSVPSLRLAWPADRFRQAAGIGLTLGGGGGAWRSPLREPAHPGRCRSSPDSAS